MEKNIKIENFIGVYDGFIMKQMCEEVIKFYNEKKDMNQAFTRLQTENCSTLIKKDTTVAIDHQNLNVWFNRFKPLLANFDITLKHYIKNSGLGDAYEIREFKYSQIRIQKTLPTEGYHVWHVEHGPVDDSPKRVMAYTIYLNDVEEGGETEFLYQSIRVKPKTGRIVIWPSGFPFVHRGNSPISGEKYLMTSWMLFE